MTDDDVQAEHELRRLVANLALQSDFGELEDYLALFTTDAVWEMPGVPAAGIPAAHRRGHDDIAASVRERRQLGVQGPGTGAVHHLTTQHFEISGDDASGHIYYQFVGNVDGKASLRTCGRYLDRYRREPDGWKLAHRTILIG